MKKQFLFLLLAFTAVIAGCEREETILERGVDYTGNILVNFNNYPTVPGNVSYSKAELALKDSVQTVTVEVKLANTTETAPTDILVYLTKVDALVSDYNTNNGGTLTAVSNTDAALQYDFTKPVVITKGSRRASVDIRVNPARLDLSKLNAIGIGILRLEGGGAAINSTSLSKLVIEFGARNKYDGAYRLKGYHNRPTLDFPYDQTMHMVSVGANSVIFFWPDAGPGGSVGHPIGTGPDPTTDVNWYGTPISPVVVFNSVTDVVSDVFNNPPNTTPITRFDGATGSNVSRFENGTRRMIVHWNYNNNPQRAFFDTLTYIGPR